MLYCSGIPDNSLLAVSGGGDSIALLHLVLENGLRIAVGHIQHGNTPAQLAAAEFVASAMQPIAVPFHRIVIETPSRGGSGYEAKARKLRYQALGELARKHGYAAIITAHTRDDVAETVAIALQRRQGIAALAGIPGERLLQLSGDIEIRVIRPFLSYSRRELREWLQERALKWFDDPTNCDPEYGLRNRIRHQWSLLNPAEYEAKIVEMLHISEAASQRMLIAEANISQSWNSVAEINAKEIRIPTPWLQSLDSDTLQVALIRIVRQLGKEAGGLPGGHRRQWEHLIKSNSWGTAGWLGKEIAYRLTKRQCWFYMVTGTQN